MFGVSTTHKVFSTEIPDLSSGLALKILNKASATTVIDMQLSRTGERQGTIFSKCSSLPKYLIDLLTIQVFSKLEQGADCVPWDEAPRNGRNPLFEPFWQQLIALSWDEELGSASQLILISAARQLVNASEVSQALATLFGSSRSLYAAAGVFSELAWQIQDRAFLEQVTQRLQDAQVCAIYYSLA